MALQHIASVQFGDTTPGRVVNTKEIAEEYNIPLELLAKVLQALSKSGMIESHNGPKGGYLLARSARQNIHAVRRVAGKGHAGPGVLACVAINHRLHVHRGALQAGDEAPGVAVRVVDVRADVETGVVRQARGGAEVRVVGVGGAQLGR